jgi:multiple antibiotic resistance protein
LREPGDDGALLALTALVFAITNLFLQKAERIMHLIGPLGVTILARIMELVLTFLAVQYVLDGLTAGW